MESIKLGNDHRCDVNMICSKLGICMVVICITSHGLSMVTERDRTVMCRSHNWDLATLLEGGHGFNKPFQQRVDGSCL